MNRVSINKLAFLLVFALATPAMLAADPGTPSEIQGAEKIMPGLRAQLETSASRATEGTRYRIVVTLRPMETAAERFNAYQSKQGLNELHGRVKEAQAESLGRLRQGKIAVLNRYASLYGFSAEADAATIAELAAQPGVAAIEEMPVFQLTDAQSFPLTGVNAVQSTGYNGAGTTIAIIDDGIDHDHAAFGGSWSFPNAKILGGYDFGDNDPDPTIDCAAQSHGTATTGVATGNGGGVTGTAPGASVVFLKVQTAADCGLPYLAGDIIGAVDWAVTNRITYGIKVISMSFGGGLYTSVANCESVNPGMFNAVNSAYAAGMILFGAAGNDASASSLSSPGCLSNVISVGAVYDANVGARYFSACWDTSTTADKVTCYSNSAYFLDLLAPADCALTAQAQGTTNSCFNGTSSATPFVAGVAADLLQRDPNLNNDTMRALLTSTGVPVTDPRNAIVKPRIDAAAALSKLGQVYDCSWSANIKESNGTAYICPSNKVMIGRQHSGDENGNTRYYCCSAGTPQATPTSCAWSANIKESNGTAYSCPANQFMFGRQHSGDENGNTRYYCCNLTQNGLQVPIATPTCLWSGWMRESSSFYQCPLSGKILNGRQHSGDENGNTRYSCCNPSW